MSVIQQGLLAAILAPFALAFWVAFRRRELAPRLVPPVGFRDPIPSRAGFAAEYLELEPMVLAAAQSMRDQAWAHYVQVEVAVKAGTRVRVDPHALEVALHSALLTAIQASPGGQVLVTGATLGSQLHIRITDDGRDSDQRTRESLARDAAELIAMQGGTIAVETRAGRGTTVTLRLPLPAEIGVPVDAGVLAEIGAKLKAPPALAEQMA